MANARPGNEDPSAERPTLVQAYVQTPTLLPQPHLLLDTTQVLDELKEHVRMGRAMSGARITDPLAKTRRFASMHVYREIYQSDRFGHSPRRWRGPVLAVRLVGAEGAHRGCLACEAATRSRVLPRSGTPVRRPRKAIGVHYNRVTTALCFTPLTWENVPRRRGGTR